MEGMGGLEGDGAHGGGQDAHAQPGSHMGCCFKVLLWGVALGCASAPLGATALPTPLQDTHAVINVLLMMKGGMEALSAGRGRQDPPHHSRPKTAVGRGQSPAAGCDASANTSSSALSLFPCGCPNQRGQDQPHRELPRVMAPPWLGLNWH